MRQKYLNNVDRFLDQPKKHSRVLYIDRSNRDLTVYIIDLWMTVLHDREFFDKAELISIFILGQTYEEYKIDVSKSFIFLVLFSQS